ncbi:xanthine dehydrogenase family protein molybdopterin-binding subunit [Pseudonocardia sp.]|jgi:xanthine dehydrogenase YagR molybdenum-binding subunit|uniref:xanthine dehydrogenase family protein molybdopterin-binding subunit n=1 Tax=Pseudonocardia sp. TaxID=60912 RepID=UPI0026384ADC|nr:xanthine dehydrogenase family protein molybdopterin-binding subunit [Pseudonocardia sp.]MCW2721896.1 aerobic-type carbon monoxide dehydrogenase, large subunit CoxL/CutL-like protein [Pseudonocardia sp.]
MTATRSDAPQSEGPFVGRRLPRADGVTKVTGRADYAIEHDPTGVAHAVVVESTIASGRVLRFDTEKAEAMPGVVRILTHVGAPTLHSCPLVPEGSVMESFRPLQDDRVRYSGQPIGVVVAETLEQATEAARHVRVEYETAQAVADIGDPGCATVVGPPAERNGRKNAHGQDCVQSTTTLPPASERGDARKALESCALRVEQTYTTPRETSSPLEPLGTIAEWSEDGSLTVWMPSQWVEGAHRALADWFGMPIYKVRVVAPFVGGGFGAKVTAHPDSSLAAMAASIVGRPVKLALTRPQTFNGYGPRPAIEQKLTLGADAEGRLQAILHDNVNETSFDDEYVETGSGTAKVMYAVPNLSATQGVVKVNSFTPSWKRAPGEAIGAFALESAMDELAYEARIDPIELRLRNYAEQDPQTGTPWSTRRLRQAYETGARAFGWERRTWEPRSMRDGRQLIGWGMAGGAFPVVRTPAEAGVTILDDGSVQVTSSGPEIGNGTYTIVAQTVADAIGVPVDRVSVQLGDTSFPGAPVAGVSQIANSLTGAVQRTALAARDELIALALDHEASPLRTVAADALVIRDGVMRDSGGSGPSVPIGDLLRRVGTRSIEVTGDTLPEGSPEDARDQALHTFKLMKPPTSDYSVYDWCAQFVEVRVDEDYGTVRISRMVGAFDSGRLYNPTLAESQWKGGMVMGVGEALLESLDVDRRFARIVNNNFAEYMIPVNADIPDIEVISVGEPDPHASALGGKSVGEIGVVGVAAAVANAVFHATGKRVRDLPITMEKLMT